MNCPPILIPALLWLTLSVSSRAGDLKVGFGQVEITPPAGVTMTGPGGSIVKGTEDPLMTRAMVVRNGRKTLAIVGIDLVKIRRDIADKAIALASEKTGIKPDAIMICPSHNHSSPLVPMGGPVNRSYLATLPKLIADSIGQAFRKQQPARMFLGRSLVYEGHHNRRVISKSDGLALNTWLKKLDDIKQTPQVLGTEGPIDPELWVARFDSMDGQLLGTLVNFACHPNHRDRKNLKTWSADFPGVIATQMAKEYGNQAVCLFTQGCSGNINPAAHYAPNSPDWKKRADVFAKAAVDAAKRAIPIEGEIPVDFARREVTVPRSDPASQRQGAIARLGWRPEMFDSAKKTLEKLPPTRNVPVNAMRIGPLGIASNPGELFVEWGISLKRKSPFPYTIVSELSNDWIGYEPTKRGFAHEGYETLAGVNFITLEGTQKMIDTAVELLEGLWRNGAHPQKEL